MVLCDAWATEADLPDTCADNEAIQPETITDAMMFASEILYDLTKRKYPGVCTDTYHPVCGLGCWSPCCTSYRPILPTEHGYPVIPTLYYGRILNSRPCHEGILLPGFPVVAITKVTIAGVDLDAADYKLYDRRLLRRVDGSLWPCGCDYDVIDDFTIEYTWGRNPTPGLVRAAALLGWEFALAWTPQCVGQCQLPARVQTVTRQGVTYAVIDPLTLFKDGMTGIAAVDLLVQAHNRGESHRRATVAVPGARPSGIRT
jgi:hypothetical protein